MVIKVTSGHLKLAALVAWLVGGLPTITWLALAQYLPMVAYLQVFLPYILLYSLAVSFEIVRGFVTKGA